MQYQRSETPQAVTLEPAGEANASVIWLHGLGADGNDFVPIIPELRLPEPLAVRFVFPHAAMRPVTINNGQRMRAWYDIAGFGPGSQEDEAGIRESGRRIAELIEREAERGIDSRNVVLAGFSQGGAMALYAGLRHDKALAGVVALSTYLPLRDRLKGEIAAVNSGLPILMCHGTLDGVVTLLRGQQSRQLLQNAGYHIDWREYPMQHELCLEEINAIAAWLRQRLAPG